MSEDTTKAQERLVKLEAFIDSPEHAAYVSAREQEISDVQSRILLTPPVNQDQIATQLLAFGELSCLEEMKTCFIDARAHLKQKIDEMVDRDNQNAENTKT